MKIKNFKLKIKLLVMVLICIIGSIYLLSPSPLFAQANIIESNCVLTKVGNPLISPPADCGDVVPGGGTPPYNPSDYRQEIIKKFGITFNNFDEKRLKWAWNSLWSVSDTKLIKLLKGAIVTPQPSGTGYSQQVGCPPNESVRLARWSDPFYYGTEGYFKFNLMHEFGHVIQNCNPREVDKEVEHANAIVREGNVSRYGECGGNHEDYADMIAYYLNPAAGFSNAPLSCEPWFSKPANPFFKLKPPKQLHLNVAKQVLQ